MMILLKKRVQLIYIEMSAINNFMINYGAAQCINNTALQNKAIGAPQAHLMR
jgi:hypothetical protein